MKINTILFFIAMVSKSGIETPDFNRIKQFKDFELRDYGSIIIAKTTLERDFSQSNSIGFQRVASYIFGGNDKNIKIEMTAPVMTSFNSLNQNEQEVSFVMPKKHNLSTLPLSIRKDVKIKQRELGIVAAISFGGWATQEKVDKYIKKLKVLMENEKLKTSNEIIIAQYNSPWIIPPFRKNEILIPLHKKIK